MTTVNLYPILRYLNKINQNNVILTKGDIWTEEIFDFLLKYYNTFAKIEIVKNQFKIMRINIASFNSTAQDSSIVYI